MLLLLLLLVLVLVLLMLLVLLVLIDHDLQRWRANWTAGFHPQPRARAA